MDRLRILVEAYECSPARAHTAGSAWQIVSRLSKSYDLWVLTEASQYQAEIEKYLAANPAFSKSMHFIFIEREIPKKKYKSRPVLPVYQVLSYRRWLKKSYLIAKQLHEKIHFDIVHHLRGNSFREPGYCWRLSVPFVWGPTGGRTCVPWQLMGILDIKSRFFHLLRNLINALQFQFAPRVRKALRKASYVIAQTSYDQLKFMEVHRIRTVQIHEQATFPHMNMVHSYDDMRPLRIAWIGQLVSRKGLPILLKAMIDPKIAGKIQLNIVGDGPMKSDWMQMSSQLKIAECCKWHGWLPHSETINMMRYCDVMVVTSLLEATSTAVTEALSVGLPIICLKHCGFGDIVDHTCGITIKVDNIQSVIINFANALGHLIHNPGSVQQLSIGSCAKSCLYDWDNLAKKILKIYQFAYQSNQNQRSYHAKASHDRY